MSKMKVSDFAAVIVVLMFLGLLVGFFSAVWSIIKCGL